MKKVIPSLREKKRYLVFEVISKGKIAREHVMATVKNAYMSYLGQLEAGKAGVIVLGECYDEERQRGIIKVGHRHLDSLRASLSLARLSGGEPVIIRSMLVSGILGKAKDCLGR
jgi:ribonuclease P/MRP protein subunit POP5